VPRLKRPLPVGDEKVAAVRSMFDAIAPRYDLVNRVMTFGLDLRWRRTAVGMLAVPRGSVVVDVACGTGDFCRGLEAAGNRPIGIDLSWGMLRAARTTAPLVQADGLRMPFPAGVMDGITCGFALRNVADVSTLLTEFQRVLRPGGRIAILEVAEPESRMLRAAHTLYFRRVVPIIGGVLSDRDAYGYLPQSTAYLPPQAKLLERFVEAGFPDVRSRSVGLGAAQIITGTKSG
jgi:demethylmenaquinone methyltransferase/2-methoxy-6-polyprenyl-1,4-benzoquinol methylase